MREWEEAHLSASPRRFRTAPTPCVALRSPRVLSKPDSQLLTQELLQGHANLDGKGGGSLLIHMGSNRRCRWYLDPGTRATQGVQCAEVHVGLERSRQ